MTVRGDFKRLVLPEYRYDGYDPGVGWYVLLSYIDGEDFRRRWHYDRPLICGGLALTSFDIELVLDLADDLRSVPVDPLVDAGARLVTPKKAFCQLERRIADLQDADLISQSTSKSILGIVSTWANPVDRCRPFSRSFSMSNADFRFLNFVEVSPQQTALIDWDGLQVSNFETEHCIAYQWLFLWKRPDLQRQLVNTAIQRFSLDRSDILAVILLRAVLQMHTVKARSDRLEIHATQVLTLLNEGFL